MYYKISKKQMIFVTIYVDDLLIYFHQQLGLEGEIEEIPE